MQLKISHTTQYNFSSKVFLEPHYLRFKPKHTLYLELKSFKITVSPNPVGVSETVDAEGNQVFLCWFDALYNVLKIKTESIVQLNNFNPFNFIVYPLEFNDLLFQYSKQNQELLSIYLKSLELSREIIEYVNSIKTKTNSNTIQFIGELTRQIHQDIIINEREKGIPFEPNITFTKKKGSCRDLAWMQIHMLRHLGIAARFVSGYLYIQSEELSFELHAWVEAFIPGAGWIGLDPSHGIFTENTHIPVSASAFYENTMPVTGSIRGDAESELSNKLHIEEI